MFKFNCPYCRQEIESEDEWAGQMSECPNCGKTIEIKRPQKPIGPQLRKAQQPQPDLVSKVPPLSVLVRDECFWLGFLLSLLGVLVALLIKGKNAAIMALYGIAFSVLFGLVLFLGAAIVGSFF